MAAPQVFPYRPTVETAAEITFRTLDAQFGDGYKQSVGDGINNRREKWDVSFRGKKVYVFEIKDVLDALQGFHPLLWTPKDGVQAMYESKSYKLINHHNGTWTLTTTFSQVF